MLIGSWKYEEITQNPLDFLTPTWMRPQLSVVSLLFIRALKEVCPSALHWTDILSLLWSSRFCSLWVTLTIGGFSINYHWNACGTEEGLFEVGLQIMVLKLCGCRDLAWSLPRGQQLLDSVSCCSCAGLQYHSLGDVGHSQLGSLRGVTPDFSTLASKAGMLFWVTGVF